MFGMGTGGTSLLSTPAALKNRIEILTDELFRELKKDQSQKEKQPGKAFVNENCRRDKAVEQLEKIFKEV